MCVCVCVCVCVNTNAVEGRSIKGRYMSCHWITEREREQVYQSAVRISVQYCFLFLDWVCESLHFDLIKRKEVLPIRFVKTMDMNI